MTNVELQTRLYARHSAFVIPSSFVIPSFVNFLALISCISADEPSDANGIIRAKAGSSEIVITTTSRLAGAIHSLTWNDKEFIDSTDHGRQLQSAASFDCGRSGPFCAECFNPTEAGSRRDGDGRTSSSKLLRLRAYGNELETTTQMAFWLAPVETSEGQPALNDGVLSRHNIRKHVKIGYRDLPHVVQYDAVFAVPPGERHKYAQFEALTGYMPSEFDTFWTYDLASGQLQSLDDGPGEQSLPVVFSTANGSHAMGVYSPDQPSAGYEEAGYGRFRFTEEKVVKWNCVFRVRDPSGVAPGEYAFRMFVVVGSLDDAKASLAALARLFR